jgi:hypothetical protein
VTGALPNAATEEERRREHRPRVLKGATIIGAAGHSSGIACTIRNMHSQGAELRVDPASPVPALFLLYVPVDGAAYRCEPRWRHGDRCGVMITGKEGKPAGQY